VDSLSGTLLLGLVNGCQLVVLLLEGRTPPPRSSSHFHQFVRLQHALANIVGFRGQFGLSKACILNLIGRGGCGHSGVGELAPREGTGGLERSLGKAGRPTMLIPIPQCGKVVLGDHLCRLHLKGTTKGGALTKSLFWG
jgi:hypothetical protein